MHKKLGIIAGGGAIPQDLINFCKENKQQCIYKCTSTRK